MGKTLYLECFSGISGDMMVASLLDLGADATVLNRTLASIPVRGFQTKISRKNISGLDVCDFDVILEHDNHDHDMDYLFPKGDGHEHGSHEEKHHTHEDHCEEHHVHDTHAEEHHEHEHKHADDEKSAHHHHHHEHRNLSDVMSVIDGSEMTDGARGIAKKIFNIIAEAEAKAHGKSIEEVHFHEVGAIDSIVDIISTAVCLDNLDITECIVPALYEGQGFVHCAHGDMPIPVPAVVNITQANNINLHITDMEAELVTPTGAAIVAAIRTGVRLPESYTIKSTGIGAGKRAYKRPSMLRAMIIESDLLDKKSRNLPDDGSDVIYKLESNIDDVTGEALGFCMDRLLSAGARDVHYIPCFMKKNRPAYVLNVICTEDMIPIMESIIFEETTTIGIRRSAMERTILKREELNIETSFGTITVKKVILPKGDARMYPEYSSIVKACEVSGKSYIDVYNEVMNELREILN